MITSKETGKPIAWHSTFNTYYIEAKTVFGNTKNVLFCRRINDKATSFILLRMVGCCMVVKLGQFQTWWRTGWWQLKFGFRMLQISWTEKKSISEVLRAAGVQRTLMNTIHQWQLNFLGHVVRRHGLENWVVTGKVEGRRARGRQSQRLKYLDSLSTFER